MLLIVNIIPTVHHDKKLDIEIPEVTAKMRIINRYMQIIGKREIFFLFLKIIVFFREY